MINPRVRNKKVFKKIVANIGEIGLKRPITVARRESSDGMRYDLVAGQGRFEAFQRLGQLQVPAIVVDADSEECLIMSLVENLARWQHRAIDLLHDLEGLKRRSYTADAIAAKTGLSPEYVRAVINLFEKGEHRLLRAVESGHTPAVGTESGDPDPTSAETAGDAAQWGGSSAAVGMAANPLGAHQPRWSCEQSLEASALNSAALFGRSGQLAAFHCFPVPRRRKVPAQILTR